MKTSAHLGMSNSFLNTYAGNGEAFHFKCVSQHNTPAAGRKLNFTPFQ